MTQETNVNVYASTVNGKLTVEELLKKEKEFPYCSMIQFQLLQEYSNIDTETFKERAQKSALYFPDLLKLNWILHLNNQLMQENNSFHKRRVLSENASSKLTIEKLEQTKPTAESEQIVKAVETPLQINKAEAEPVNQNFEVHAPYIDNPGAMETEVNGSPVLDEVAPITDQIVEEEILTPELKSTHQPSIFSEQKEENVNNESAAVNNESVLMNEMPIPKIDSTKSIAPTEEIVFEPLYTKDYFASLGIKLTDNPPPNDKLGNQMKSFTQWLKSMKKINLEKLNEPDEVVDKKIQIIAEKSNSTDEVVTESMADVLLLQGKHQKAIEMYEKLSLINPSKSAYFAAIISSVKKSLAC